jgi:hypothetical protein
LYITAGRIPADNFAPWRLGVKSFGQLVATGAPRIVSRKVAKTAKKTSGSPWVGDQHVGPF